MTRVSSTKTAAAALLSVFLLVPAAALGQEPDPDRRLNLAEPDFTIAALPTTLRLPAGTFGFRLTHRFTRPIGLGSVGDFFADFFGFDGSARIGLEVRYGLWPGGQIVAHRTNDRSIQLLGQQALWAQSSRAPFAAQAIVAVEGANNFREDFSGAIGVVLSRAFKDRGAIYAHPILVVNANRLQGATPQDEHAFVMGVGFRVRLGQSRVYLIAEGAPRLAGFHEGVDLVSVGIERRSGGHMFQFTIANGLGTTLRQVAQGGVRRSDWYVGFNLSRKFF